MSAPPDAVSPVGDLPAQLESDIASVFLARLDGLFEREALGLHRGALPEGSFLARIGQASFWTCALCTKDLQRCNPAVQFYLIEIFPGSAGMPFRELCRVWGQSFYAARHDRDSARDLLLLFLDQNLRALKDLYILEQPHHQRVAPDASSVQRCLQKPDNAVLFTGGHFARWVLEEWLPFHLRFVCCRGFLAPDDALSGNCLNQGLAGMSMVCH